LGADAVLPEVVAPAAMLVEYKLSLCNRCRVFRNWRITVPAPDITGREIHAAQHNSQTKKYSFRHRGADLNTARDRQIKE
jgi:hypothetical protein